MKRSQSLNDPIFARAMSTEPRRMQSEIITDVPNHDRPVVHLPTPTPNEATSLLGNLDNIENRTCPTCGIYDSWCGIRKSWDHQICVPSIGPAKPRRIKMEYEGNTWWDYHFDMENMTPAERVASGGNMFRTVGINDPDQLCAISMQPCQEKGPTQWKQFTGWEWCSIGAWQNLCWRYHTEYLEPNGYVNTLGRFLVFLEE